MADVPVIPLPGVLPSQVGAKGLEIVGAATADAAKSLMGVGGVSTDPGNQNVCVNDWNVIESGLTRCVIMGGGTEVLPNLIGSTAKPFGTSAADPAWPEWTEDIGYPVGTAHVALIGGGYDNIGNQINCTIAGGGHQWIKYHLLGHSGILSGAFNLVCGGFSVICAGLQGLIGPLAQYSAIVVSRASEIRGSYSFMGATQTCSITSDYSFMAAARNSKASHIFSSVQGDDGASPCNYSRTLATTKFAEQGDAQRTELIAKLKTTNSTQAILPTINLIGVAGKTQAHVLDVTLSAVRPSDGAVSVYRKRIMVRITGAASATITDLETGTTTTSVGPVMNLDEEINGIGIVTLPQFRVITGASGILWIRPTGLDATDILWNASINALKTSYTSA